MYNGWVSEIAKRFQRRFDEVTAVYNFDLGDEFEIAVADVLRQMLPDRFGVCRGFVVEQSGKLAGDDIIVYDRARFSILRFLGEDLSRKEQVPVEAVLAYIEAKHRLHLTGDGGQSLRKACEQVAAVRALHRAPVPLNTMAPYVRFMGETVAPPNGWPTIRNPMYCAVFARYVEPERDAREVFADAMRELHEEGLKLPDTVAAGRVMSLPANYRRPEGGGRPTLAIRPCLDVPGNEPIFTEPDAVFGAALLHLLSSIEIMMLGSLPWPDLLNEAVTTGRSSFVRWSHPA